LLLAARQRAAVNNAILGNVVRARAVQARAIRAAAVANPYLGGMGLGNPYLGGRLNNNIVANPYLGSPGTLDNYGGYGSPGGVPVAPYFSNPYVLQNPYSGYLRGVSSVIDAQGQYAINYQQARLLNQQAEQAKIDTKRKIFDEWRYERMHTPTYEQRRQKKLEKQVVRARNNPPLTEILSADALNALLRHIQKRAADGVKGPTVAVDADLLKKINVTTARGGNIGLFRDAGKLNWPLGLKKDVFNEARESLSQSAPESVRQAELTGRVDTSLMMDMLTDAKALRTTLEKNVGDMSPSMYIEALRYLNFVDDALKALQDPEVSNYFTKKYAATGRDVAEVVDNMTKSGLTFTAAVPGDGPSYTALHGLLVAFADALDRGTTVSK
jgi:hypothetical protein